MDAAPPRDPSSPGAAAPATVAWLGPRVVEDYALGEVLRPPPVTIGRAEILRFAREWDPQAIHIDEVYGRAGPHGDIIASGFHTVPLAFTQIIRLGVFLDRAIGGPGMDEVRWLEPIFPDDTLAVTATVVEARASRSKPDRGILRLSFTVANQHGRTVLTFITTSMIRSRAGVTAAAVAPGSGG